MNDTWKLTVWGVRGSAPAPGANYAAYGGNTSCFSVDRGDTVVVLDADSGLTALGEELVRRRIRRVDILLSHLHLDHLIQGQEELARRADSRIQFAREGMVIRL